MNGPPVAADHNGFSIQKKPGAVHAGVVQGGEVKGSAVLCALRTSSRINEYLAQREWTLYRAKNAGKGSTLAFAAHRSVKSCSVYRC